MSDTEPTTPRYPFYKFLASVILMLLLAKAWLDVDSNWDTWAYHLPFAARLWNIIPADQYVFDPLIQRRFEGFAMLGEWFQGLFWWVTHRVQAANLFSVFTFIGFLAFLQTRLQVPFYMSLFALLAIPLVQIHVPLSYIDLPANLFTAMFLLSLFLWLTRPESRTRAQALWMGIFSILAVNIKLFYLPVILAGWLALGIHGFVSARHSSKPVPVIRYLPLILLIGVFLFSVPIKNTLFHGNPFHGVKVHVAGMQISKGEDFTYDVPNYLAQAPAVDRWVQSLLEFHRPALFWTVDQHYPLDTKRQGEPGDRMGGFFREYVLFHLLLLGVLAYTLKNRDTRIALALVTGMTVVTAMLPMSFQLRYTIYWMVVLLSLNLYLLLQHQDHPFLKSVVQPARIHLVIFCFFALVTGATGMSHIRPLNHPVGVIRDYIVKDHLKSAPESNYYCVQGVFPYTMLYTTNFHPDRPPYTIEDAGQDLDLNVKLEPGPCRGKLDPVQVQHQFQRDR